MFHVPFVFYCNLSICKLLRINYLVGKERANLSAIVYL